jgi:hypothetical protein
MTLDAERSASNGENGQAPCPGCGSAELVQIDQDLLYVRGAPRAWLVGLPKRRAAE